VGNNCWSGRCSYISLYSYAKAASRFFFSFGGVDPSTRSNSWFSATYWKSLLLSSRSPAGWSYCSSRWAFPRFQIVAAPRSLGSWFHCCLPGASVVSFRLSVLSGFLLQIYLWFDSSTYLLWTTVLHDCVPAAHDPCTVPLLPAGHLPARYGQLLLRSTISLVPNFPENISLAPCHCCTTRYFPADGSQLPAGFTVSSGHFLLHSTSLCS
jgi:hypothetical protein